MRVQGLGHNQDYARSNKDSPGGDTYVGSFGSLVSLVREFGDLRGQKMANQSRDRRS